MTPGGLLSKGDRLVCSEIPGRTFKVVERTSNTKEDYSIWIADVTGAKLTNVFRIDRLRNNGREYIMLEAHYHVFIRGGWKYVRP